MSKDQGDTPGNAQAPAAAGAQAEDAYKSAVDFSDLQAELDKAAEADEGDGEEDEDQTNSTDQGDAGDDTDPDDDGDEADESDDDAEDGDEDESDDEDDRPRKRNRSQRYRDQIQRLQDENAQLRGRQTRGSLTDAQIEARVKEIIGEPPTEEDFPGDFLAYDREALAYAADKRAVIRQVKQEAQQAAAADATRNVERVERHHERVTEFRTRGATKEERAANAADFDQVVASAKGMKVAPHVEDLILDSRKSAHLQYYFAKNPDKLESMNRMSELQAARAMGAIESRLSVPKPKTKSSAPNPPPRPRGGVAAPSQDAEVDAYITRRYGKQT